jgi:hypothetical protein
MIDALLSVIVLGAIAVALFIDIAAVAAWLRSAMDR